MVLQLETSGVGAVCGLSELSDEKLIHLMERYMVERQRLRNNGVHGSKHQEELATVLGLSLADAMTLEEQVNYMFQGF